MRIAVPKEIGPGEARVAIVPETIRRLVKKGLEVSVESGAGEGARFADEEYKEAGALIEPSANSLLGAADVVVKVQHPTPEEIEKTREGAALISFLFPLINLDAVQALGARTLTRQHLGKSDVCVTTALIPGQRAPILITDEMVRDMRPGSVIVDLAAEQGGNCALTEPGTEVVRHGVSIIGPLNRPGRQAAP